MSSPAVLVVGDELPVVEIVTVYLARVGYRVPRAYDGRAALDLESPGPGRGSTATVIRPRARYRS